jgi:hypothetical protein
MMWSDDQVSFGHVLVCKWHSSRLFIRETEYVSKESQLATFYTVDKRLCLGHVINGGVRDMIHAFDF